MSHWTYKGNDVVDIPEGMFGFVYRITHRDSGVKYIGRKYFESRRRKVVPGKVRRKVVVTESNWRTYTSSSKELNALIEEHGKAAFDFEILAYASTKGACNFLEEAVQHVSGCLYDDSYLNGNIGNGSFRSVKISDDLKQSLKELKEIL